MSPRARLLLSVAALLAGLAVPWIAGRAPQAVELIYSRGVFPLLARVLGAIGRAVPFSWAQIVVVLSVAGIGLGVARAIQVLRTRRRERSMSFASRTIFGIAAVVWLFQLSWGLHYSRPTLLDRLGYPAVQPDAVRLTQLVRSLVLETNRAYEFAVREGEILPAPDPRDAGSETVPERVPTGLPGSEQSDSARAGSTIPSEVARERDGVVPLASQFAPPVSTIIGKIDEGYRVIDPTQADIRYAPPKRPEPASALLTAFGISGIYFPFTGESNVNGRIPMVSIPFTSAHEMAHQRGIAREDEANLMAYLACRASGSAVAHYSGALSALTRARRALWRTAPDSLAPAGAALGPGPRADIETIRRFWTRHEGPAAQVAERVNDSYLKANAQSAGVASYDRMIEILVALQESGALDDRIPRIALP